MTQSLLKPVKNKGGSIASGRLDYQKDWSLCRLLEAHATGVDYALIFEHDDDLMLVFDKGGQKRIAFYQVKTKDLGVFSTTELLRSSSSKKNGGLSIIGKLYANKIKYGAETDSLNLVSNARFKVELAGGANSEKKREIRVDEFSKEELQKVIKKLEAEHSLGCDPETKILFLRVADLALEDSRVHATGKLSDFLSRLSPGKKFNPQLAYQGLFEEIRRRCNHVGEYKNLDDLRRFKSISRQDFLAMLDVIGLTPNSKKFDAVWQQTETRLNQEKLDLRRIVDIRFSWIDYEAHCMDYSDTVHSSFQEVMRAIVQKQLSAAQNVANLTQFLEESLSEFRKTAFHISQPELYTDPYVMASVLSIYYEEPKLPEAH